MMKCPEYERLWREYESSLKQWGEAKLSHAVNSTELRMKASQDRYVAKKKLDLHMESCRNCSETWRVINTLLRK
jgi:hypothetical protein